MAVVTSDGLAAARPRGISDIRTRHFRHSVRIAFVLAAGLTAASFTRAAEQFPDDAYHELWRSGEYREALEILEPFVESIDGTPLPRYLRDRAQLRFLTGHVDEAIEDIQALAQRYPEPAYSLELALMYRYRGKPLFYEQTLRRAYIQARNGRWRWSKVREENLVAIARVNELLGENPKQILSTIYRQIFESQPDLVIAHVAKGDMAYRHFGYDTAEASYMRALELEPDNQDALAGLSECYWRSGDPRLPDTMARLLEINPNHPRTRIIQVEQLLDLGKTGDALKLIEAGLEINPRDLHLLSLKSAAHFLDDDEKAMNAVRDKVLDFNPIWSELYRTTGRIASRHYRFEEGAAFQARALELDPKDYEARADYTLDLMRLGRETEGLVELRKAFEADSYNVRLYNMLNLTDTLATFATIERDDFVLKLPHNEAPVVAEDAVALLEGAFAHLQQKYRVSLETPVLVEMFDEHDDFIVRSVGLPGSAGHLGICFGKVVTMDAPSVRKRGSSNWRAVLWHEFVHVVTLQKTGNRMPRWLSEGISVYEEGQYSRAWRNRLDVDYAEIVANEELPGVSDIAVYFTQPKTGGHLMFGYFVAGEFVQFYVDTYGFDALVDALNGIRKGQQTVTALAKAADTNRAPLDRAFREYLEARLKPYDDLEAFGEALHAASLAVQAEDWNAAEAELNRAYALFPDYARDDAPLRQLAYIYENTNRPNEFKKMLEKILYTTPTELSAAIRLAEIYRAQGDFTSATAMAEWVLGIDPYDVSTRLALVDMMGERYGPELDRAQADTLLRHLDALLHLDTANAGDYRLRRAHLLTEKEDWGGARREVVRLLEDLPHYWEAQELLLSIVETEDGVAAPVDVGSTEELVR